MGGKALKTIFNIETRRVSNEEFFDIASEVRDILKVDLFAPVIAYKNKLDHGDIDCVVGAPLSTSQISELFNTDKIYKNSNVLSVLYKGAQIDLISVLPENFDINLHFRNYSPLGNVLGRLLKQKDVSFKVDGLFYTFRAGPGGDYKKSIFLTRNFADILAYAGLDIRNYGQFEEEADIFNFICSSPLFRKEIFFLENLNHINRKRDAVRPDYNRWNKYILDKKDNLSAPPSHEQNLEELARTFPGVLWKIDACHRDYEQQQEIRAKFNGHLVRAWTGLDGVELGIFMSLFRKKYNNEKLRQMSVESIKNAVLELTFLVSFYKQNNIKEILQENSML